MRFLYAILFIGLTNIFANNLVEIVLPHNQWKLIGVSGAFMEGSGTGEITTASPWHWGKEYDANVTTHGKYTGLKLGGNTAEYNSTKYDTYLAGFSVVNSNYQLAILSFNGTGFSVDTTLPRRKIYLDSNGNGTADTNISYQSDLEGETFNFQTTTKDNITSHYYGIFNSSYGETNPMTLSRLTGTSSTYTFKIRDIIDMNLTNNPGKDGQSGNLYDYTQNNDRNSMVTGDDYLKVFRLDSTNSIWESFNSNVADSSNDFTTLTSGSAYWVKLYDKNEATKKHGFILGDGNISIDTYSESYQPLSSSYKTSRYSGHRLLSNGWNMLSFPDGAIRYSGTGLILELNSSSAVGKEFNITDEVGKESILIHIYDINTTTDSAKVAQNINLQIMGAIEDGDVSRNFNIRAFGQDGNITLLSDKKFRVYDKNSSGGTDDIFGKVLTLGGQSPYDLNSSTYKAISNLGVTGVASRYGEYALIVTVNNDGEGNVSGFLNQGVGQMSVNDINFSLVPSSDKIQNISTISDNTDITRTSILDLDLNDKNDSILLVGTSPFYIRDNTFTKVYRLDDNSSFLSSNTTIYIDTTGNGDYTEVALNTSSQSDTKHIISQLNSALSSQNIDSNSSGDYIYMTTVNPDYKKFDLKEYGTDDIFTRVISSDPLALGSITKVYSISDLAKSDVNKSIVVLKIDANDSNVSNYFNITIDGNTTECIIPADINAGKICIDCVAQINSLSSANVFAECNTSTAEEENATLTFTGYFSKLTFETNSSDTNVTVSWEKNSTGGVALQTATTTLTDNLQYNPIYSPNYPTSDGVLKYIRENGFKAEAILTAVDDGAGSISWKYTDLTAESDDWFDAFYDYSLFTTEMENGYFVRLSTNPPASINLAKTLNLDFYQHYNNDETDKNLSVAGNVDNFFKGTLTVTVSGDEGDNTQVVATIQNREYQLLQSGNSYSLDMSRANFPEIAMNDSNITLTMYDDTGNIETADLELNLSSPAKPVAQFFNGKIMFLGTTSSDLGAFNIYSGRIDDRYAIHSSNTVLKRTLTSSNDYKTVSNYNSYFGNSATDLNSNTDLNNNSLEFNNSTSTTSTTKDNIVEINISLTNAYSNTIYNYNENNWTIEVGGVRKTIQEVVDEMLANTSDTNYSSFTNIYNDHNWSIHNKDENESLTISYHDLSWYIGNIDTNFTDFNTSDTNISCKTTDWYIDNIDTNISCELDLNISFYQSTTTTTTNIGKSGVYYAYNYPEDEIGIAKEQDGNLTYFMSYNLCEDSPSFDSNNSGWRVVTVDGDGDASNSRVSNITFLPDWFSIYKNASILEVKAVNATDNEPRLYGSDCKVISSSNASQDNGVVLIDGNSSIDDNFTIAYDTISTSSIGTNIPYIRNLCISGNTNSKAQIQFAKNIYTTSFNTSLTSAKVLLIQYEYGGNTTMYKTDFDKLYNNDVNSTCYELTSSMEINTTNQTIVKGD